MKLPPDFPTLDEVMALFLDDEPPDGDEDPEYITLEAGCRQKKRLPVADLQ